MAERQFTFDVPFPDEHTKPFVNPYSPLLQQAIARQRELTDAPIPPMFNPEEAAARVQKVKRDRMYGEMGMLSRDEAITGSAKPLLAEAIKASQKQVTDHGEFDPVSGEFREFPSYRRQRQLEQVGREVTDVGAKESAAQLKFDETRQRAVDRWYSDRQAARERYERELENDRRDSALRLTLKTMGNAMGGDKGSLSYSGVDPKTSLPVYTHSKLGPIQVQPDGSFQRYTGVIGQKDSGVTAGEREFATNAVNSIGSLSQVESSLDSLKDTWQNRLTTGILPGVIAGSGQTGQALVESLRSKELNKATQVLSYVIGEVRAGRFGLTLTPSEAADSVQYLPSKSDSIERIKEKTKGLKELLSKGYNNWRATRTKPGFEAPGLPNPDAGGGDRKFEVLPE